MPGWTTDELDSRSHVPARTALRGATEGEEQPFRGALPALRLLR